MGFFDSLFGGGKKEYAPLDASSPAAQLIGNMQQPIEDYVKATDDTMEIVPTDDTAYVYLGKPPSQFGIAWIEKDGKVNNFKTLISEKGINENKITRMVGLLRKAYEDSQSTTRYSHEIGGKKIVVAPCEDLAATVKKVIDETVG